MSRVVGQVTAAPRSWPNGVVRRCVRVRVPAANVSSPVSCGSPTGGRRNRYEDLRAEAVEDIPPMHPRAWAFHHELTGRHLALGGTVGEDPVRYRPWAVDIATTPVSVFMTVVSDDAQDMVRFVHELAGRPPRTSS